jgi:hypothetical protein
MIAKEVNPVKKLFLLAVTLVTVLSLCLRAPSLPPKSQNTATSAGCPN